MQKKIIRPLKISPKINFWKKTGLSVIVLTVLFFNFTITPSFAQYSQISTIPSHATNITASGATLNGTVSVISNLYTAAWFEYGTSASFGYSTPRNSYGSGYFNYNYDISGLKASTTYYFRAVIQNSYGIQYGNINSFTTDFSSISNVSNNLNYLSLNAITKPASSVSNTNVQLNSTIYNDANSFSNTWFEYGTNLNLGNKTTPVATGTLVSLNHVNTLTGLAPGTTYYFRAVAENSSWRNNGSILSFTTGGSKQNIKTSTITNAIEENTSNTNTTQSVQSSIVANILGSDSFFPINIFGWLILLILVLILIILSKHFYRKFLNKKLYKKNV